MNWLIEPFLYPFMQHALLITTLVGLTCAILSCYIVQKGWALMGDAIAHGILPGIVLASWLGAPLWTGAFLAALLCALGSGWLQQRTHLRADTLLGIVFAALFALGLLLFQQLGGEHHLLHILFGNPLGIDAATRRQVILISIIVLIVFVLKGRDLFLYVFDDVQARIAGLPVALLQLLLLSLLSFTIVAALPAIGVILATAMLITPGLAAQLIARRFRDMILIACVIAVLSSYLGVILSFNFDTSLPAAIVLVQAASFLLLLAWRSQRQKAMIKNNHK